MLSLEIGKANFGKKIILENTLFAAEKGYITVVRGESGSGKSTFINALTFRNPFALNYLVEGENISHLSKDKYQQFIFDHYGIVYQNPQLLEDLTIQEHIDLIKQMTNSNFNEKTWVEYLELNSLLSLYPNKLSGGEQVRVALLLALIKDPDVLILDEPTSSLDGFHTQMVINTLKAFCGDEKIIIISSHDTKVVDQCDFLYEIKNKKLRLIKGDISLINKLERLKTKHYEIAFKEVSKILRKMRKHDQFYKKLLTSITVFAIAMTGFSTVFDNAIQQVYLKANSATMHNEIYVFKDKLNASNESSHAGDDVTQEIITEEEVEALRNIDHVERVEWRLDASINSFSVMPESQLHNEKSALIVHYPNGSTSDHSFVYDWDHIYINTYFKDQNYDSFILEKFSDEGVYIDYWLAEKLSEGDDFSSLKGAKLTFEVLIPVYNSTGKFWTYDLNDFEQKNPIYPTGVSGKIEVLTLPIAGILKTSEMGINNDFNQVIYVERDILENLIEQHRVTENRTLYLVASEAFGEDLVSEIPEDGEYNRIIEETPWQPRGYSVFLDDVSHLQSVVTEICNLGFYVSSPSFIASDIVESTEAPKEVIQVVTYVLSTIILLIYIVIKFNSSNSERKVNDFISNLGVTQNQIMKIKQMQYVYQTISNLCWTVVLLFLIMMVWNTILRIGYTSFDVLMCFIVVILTVLIEYAIPMIVENSIQKQVDI